MWILYLLVSGSVMVYSVTGDPLKPTTFETQDECEKVLVQQALELKKVLNEEFILRCAQNR